MHNFIYLKTTLLNEIAILTGKKYINSYSQLVMHLQWLTNELKNINVYKFLNECKFTINNFYCHKLEKPISQWFKKIFILTLINFYVNKKRYN